MAPRYTTALPIQVGEQAIVARACKSSLRCLPTTCHQSRRCAGAAAAPSASPRPTVGRATAFRRPVLRRLTAMLPSAFPRRHSTAPCATACLTGRERERK
uniref:Uncharacterized protein n=1 Tax=Oryza brachyantha TaxID=4533 RepID=J3M4L8_ORYBR